jgi:putative transposase
MGRQIRCWSPNHFYHVVMRGNRRDALFKESDDFTAYFHILETVHNKTPFDLASYCLMTNHLHLLIRSHAQPLSKVMSLLNKRYANYYNTRYRLTGHVYEKRYYAKLVDSKEGMLEVSRYIHLNPVEAHMVKSPEQYPWSSYSFFLEAPIIQPPSFMNTYILMDYFVGDPFEKRRKYREWCGDNFTE